MGRTHAFGVDSTGGIHEELLQDINYPGLTYLRASFNKAEMQLQT